MRILYIVPDLYERPGGIARYAQMVCCALASTNVQLQVVALMDHNEDGHAPTFNPSGKSYVACGGSRLLLARKCIEMTVRFSPDIILVGHVNFALLGFMLARLAHAKYATFIYGVDVWYPLSWPRRLGLQQSDKIIAISQFTVAQALKCQNIVAKDKVDILHNCLPFQIVEREPCQRQMRSLSILTVSRLVEHKGHEYVLRAMPLLLEDFPQLIYHVVGEGEIVGKLHHLAQDLGIADSVQFHGRVSEEMLDKHYANASVFVMPSRGEGFGFVFIEAMARGIPVVAGNMDASPEVVMDGQTGCIVDPTSVEAIAMAIRHLLEDAQLRQQMGQNAYKYATQQFGFDRFQQSLSNYLSELVNEKGFLNQMTRQV